MERKVQSVFRRYEKKYLLDNRQLEGLKNSLSQFMTQDAYGNYTICNLYFDTGDYALIRASIEKPAYKEKLRLRSYGVPKADDPVFAEIKKKYNGVVYKRRVAMTDMEASDYFLHGRQPENDGQIMHEIDWFVKRYHPVPKAFIAYDRTALSGIQDSELRVTFDKNIRWRGTTLDLSQGDWGMPLLQPGVTLMEIKIPGASPLWLSRLLAQLQIYPASFSKYGVCYKQWLVHEFLRKGVFACA
ncbi:MAG: polyphosphate polymerase domain-containing protein [Clostridia bacterium]|nr:polyphosphate polymerase domain-containing protein [Clostridia bacterium]